MVLIILSITSLLYIVKDIFYFKPVNYRNNTFQIIQCTYNGNYNKYIIKHKYSKYQFTSKDKYQLGDIILIDGEIEEQKVHYPNGFDYQEYLHYQNIVGIIKPSSIKLVGNKWCFGNLNYNIKQFINNKFTGKAKDYLLTLTIGVNDTLDTDNINKIGISHLFVISGLHVSMIILFFEFILNKFKLSKKLESILIITILGIYVLAVNFLISVIRVYISYILKVTTKFNQLDRISINLILVVLFNPYIIFQMSFILSYMIAFFMCIYQEKKILKYIVLNKILNLFILTFLIQLFVFPFVVTINPDFNFISILVNPFFILVVSYIFLPISFITIVFPVIFPIYEYFVSIFEYLVENCANIDILCLSLGNTNIYLKSLYYVFFYFLMRGYYLNNFKYYILFAVIIACWYFKGIFVLSDQIYFLDLPEGDASLIISKNSSQIILVDSGEITSNNILTKIIKDFGIKEIDYLIITHGDSDHIGGAYDLSKTIKIRRLVLNKYDDLLKSESLTKVAQKTYYVKANDKLVEKNMKIDVVSPSKDYKNINDNSLAFILNFKDMKIFYTGDISTKVEYDIIKNYKNINVDILKVAHHGSLTSTSMQFLNSIKYRYAVIMSGYYNMFGFPKEIVVNRIPKEKRLLTKQLNTICFLKRGKQWVLKN